jgi:hypothetical protein
MRTYLARLISRVALMAFGIVLSPCVRTSSQQNGSSRNRATATSAQNQRRRVSVVMSARPASGPARREPPAHVDA